MTSLEQYLRTSFPNPDPEFRDGHIIARSLPDLQHAQTMARVGAQLHFHRLSACISLRLKRSASRVLVPDVCAFHPVEPTQAVPDTPPFIAIEILSPDDRMNEVRSKLEEYKTWGVPHVWLVDPHAKRMYTCDQGLVEVPSLRVPELNLELSSANIFE